MFLTALLVAFLGGSASPLVINEVYYDHPGADDCHEFVELINSGSDTLDLEDYRLELASSSDSWTPLFEGGPYDLLAPGEIYLIGGDELPIYPDENLFASLPNSRGALRLLDADGIVLDRVGYGEEAVEFEGEPCPDVAAGRSLSRVPDGFDSNHNLSDFRDVAEPSPGYPNAPEFDLSLGPESPWLAADAGEEIGGLQILNRGSGEPGPVKISWHIRLKGVPAAYGEALFLSPAPGLRTPIFLPAPALSENLYEIEVDLEEGRDENPLNDTWRGPLRIGRPAVVITEIMYQPIRRDGEWIEIFNASGSTQDLSGWTVADARGSPRLLDGGNLRLRPNRFLVLCQDSTVFRDLHGPNVRVQQPWGGWPSLNDTDRDGAADRIVLLDRHGIPIEAVIYSDLLGSARGISLERPHPPEPGRETPPWFVSMSPHGSTPGIYNSQKAAFIERGLVKMEPNPFQPGRHSCRIGFFLEPQYESWSVIVFDLWGREIWRTEGRGYGGGWKSVEWPGLNDAQALPVFGPHLIAIVRSGAGTEVVSKHVVVAVRE